MRVALAVLAAATLASCQTVEPEAPRATASLQPTQGNKTFGEATFEQTGNKVRAWVYVQGLKPGADHGLQIASGDCGGMASASGMNLPALKAAKNGRAKVDAELNAVTVAPGPNSIVGRTVTVQTGSGGAPLACGVIRPG